MSVERHVFTRVRLEDEVRRAEILASLRVGDRIADQQGNVWRVGSIIRRAGENTAHLFAIEAHREGGRPIDVWESEVGATR